MSREHGGDTCILVSRLTKIFRPLEVHPLSWPPIRRQSPVCVLRDVDLSVGRGEILGLLGTNGAGKTTLLKILATLILPTAGRITIEGVDVIHEPHRAIQLVSLVTADERSFYWPLTGRQNLEFFMHQGRLLSSGIVEALCQPTNAHGTALGDMLGRLTTMSHL